MNARADCKQVGCCMPAACWKAFPETMHKICPCPGPCELQLC